MKCIDLTHKYKNGMTFGSPENHPIVSIEPMAKLEQKGFNTSKIILGSHLGTHMDGKRHMIKKGQTTDAVDISLLNGDVTVADLSQIESGARVQVKDLEGINVTERMIFSFGWSQYFGTEKYSESWPSFSTEAIRYLIDGGLRFIGMDIIGPDAKNDKRYPCHRALFDADVVIVENLANTEAINFAAQYRLMALPLSIEGSDGAPIRVILIEK